MITRTTLLGGPAAAIWNGHTYFAQSGIVVTPALELEAVDSDAQGILDATATLAPVMIKFAPVAPFADLVELYPWLEGAPGTSLFGASDSPLVLIAANGVRLTFAAAAIVQMPDLTLGVSGATAGAVTFLALGGRQILISTLEREVPFNIFAFYRGRHTYVGIDSLALDSRASAAVLRELLPGFSSGQLRPFEVRDTACYPLDQAAAAYRAVLAGARDRIVLRMA